MSQCAGTHPTRVFQVSELIQELSFSSYNDLYLVLSYLLDSEMYRGIHHDVDQHSMDVRQYLEPAFCSQAFLFRRRFCQWDEYKRGSDHT